MSKETRKLINLWKKAIQVVHGYDGCCINEYCLVGILCNGFLEYAMDNYGDAGAARLLIEPMVRVCNAPRAIADLSLNEPEPYHLPERAREIVKEILKLKKQICQ